MNETEQTFSLTTPSQKIAFLLERGWEERETQNGCVVYHPVHKAMSLDDAYRSYFRVVEE